MTYLDILLEDLEMSSIDEYYIAYQWPWMDVYGNWLVGARHPDL